VPLRGHHLCAKHEYDHGNNSRPERSDRSADDDAAKHTKSGEATSGSAMPAGSTRVTVILDAEGDGTRLTLRHSDLPSPKLRDGHQVAWETYLPRLVSRAAGTDPGADPHS